jgi:hypothetical protein
LKISTRSSQNRRVEKDWIINRLDPWRLEERERVVYSRDEKRCIVWTRKSGRKATFVSEELPWEGIRWDLWWLLSLSLSLSGNMHWYLLPITSMKDISPFSKLASFFLFFWVSFLPLLPMVLVSLLILILEQLRLSRGFSESHNLSYMLKSEPAFSWYRYSWLAIMLDLKKAKYMKIALGNFIGIFNKPPHYSLPFSF